MIDEQPRCENPACGNELVLIPGHRRRQYCSDTCKMAAHRARIARENQARYEALQLELARQEREALRQRWGDLPRRPSTCCALCAWPTGSCWLTRSPVCSHWYAMRRPGQPT